MTDLKKFRENVQRYRKRKPNAEGRRYTQKNLAEAIGRDANELSHRLNGSGRVPLSQEDVLEIVLTLAEWQTLHWEEAENLLALMDYPLDKPHWKTELQQFLTPPSVSSPVPSLVGATNVIGKLAKENEQIIFIRQKIEEIYTLTCKICQKHNHLYEEIAGLDEDPNEFFGEGIPHDPYASDDPILCLEVFEDNEEKIAPLIEKCEMIVSLYMQDFAKDFSIWLKDLKELRKKIQEDLSNGTYTSSQEEKYLERTTQSHDRLKTKLSMFAKKKGITKG